METIVVKGSDFSLNDIKLMEETVYNLPEWDKMVKIVLIYPSGATKEIVTSYNTFKIVNESGKNSIIYQ